MLLTLLKTTRGIAFFAVTCIFILLNGTESSEAAVNGALRQVGNQQILNLWGTNYEMGYAHGYLVADKIRDLIDNYMIGTLANGSVSAYNALLWQAASSFQWQTTTLDEIQGITDGMVASGKNLYVSSLGRNIDARDIRAFNLQEEFFFGCSVFGAWGSATKSGETLLARNLDFFYDNQGDMVNYLLIIAYEQTGMAKFASIAWPGFIGLYSGINESGVTLFVNKGNGSNSTTAPFHPAADVVREILQNTTVANYTTQPLSILNSGNNEVTQILPLGIPYQGFTSPVYVLEEGPGRT